MNTFIRPKGRQSKLKTVIIIIIIIVVVVVMKKIIHIKS